MRFIAAVLFTAFLTLNATAQVLLVKPRTSAMADVQADAGQKLSLWTSNMEILLRESGVTPQVEEEDVLTSSVPRSVIILPHATHLSDDQLRALREHVDQGFGLWLTSGTGYYDQTGAVRGWGFLQELLGGKIDSTEFKAGTAASLHIRFGLPGSSALPPGYRLRLALTEPPLSLEGGKRNEIVAYWATDAYHEVESDSIPREPAFIVRNLPSGGRVVWMGAGIELVHLDPVNREMALKMMGEIIRWLDGEGIPTIEVWPEGKESAVLIHGDIEDQFHAVKNITDIIKKLRLPATYNMLTLEAVKFPEAMASILETNCELSVHGDNHAIFTGQSYDIQHGRLQSAAGFVALYGPPPNAFRPPELAYDETTLRAAKNAGYITFLACNHPDRDYPMYQAEGRSEEAGLVMYPKSELDDYDLFTRLTIDGEDPKIHALVNDFVRIRDVGGLYKFNYHSQYLAKAEFPRIADAALTEMKGYKGVWFADSRDISKWVRERERLQLRSISEDDVIRLTLTNTSSEPIRGVVLRVHPPRKVPAELLVPREVSQSCEYDVRDGMLFAKIPPLKPGAIFRMELGAGKGYALSLINKKTLLTAVKVFAALGGVFILWFVMYLAFSGKKVRRVSVRPVLPTPDEPEIQILPKFSSRLADSAGAEPAAFNSGSGAFPVIAMPVLAIRRESTIPSQRTMAEESESIINSPMVTANESESTNTPPMVTVKERESTAPSPQVAPKAPPLHWGGRTSILPPLTAKIPSEPAKVESVPAVMEQIKLEIKPKPALVPTHPFATILPPPPKKERISRVPSLPAISESLTVVVRDKSAIPKQTKQAKLAILPVTGKDDKPKEPPAKVEKVEVASGKVDKSKETPAKVMEVEVAPGKIDLPEITELLASPIIHEQPVPLNVELTKSQISATPRPVAKEADSQTFKSASGLRTTARPPAKRAGNTGQQPVPASGHQKDPNLPHTNAPFAPKQKGLVRTSIDVINKHQNRPGSGEEWR